MKIRHLLHTAAKYLSNADYRFLVHCKLGLHGNMPDEEYLTRKYKAKLGKVLNLDNPKSFNEKLQWLKLYDRKPIYTELVDKYEVRKHVAKAIGEDCLIPLVGGPWEHFEDIDFDELPEQFVLKCTHDSGGLVICRDKSKLDKALAKAKIERCLQNNYYYVGREWPYKNVKPRIIAEAYMEDENSAKGLTDYKFFCFNGEPRMIYVSQGLEEHTTARISFYDMEGRDMPFHRSDFKPLSEPLLLPKNYYEMKESAGKLAQMVGCPFVRVDLYSVWGKLYFSEITFSPCGGMLPFEPEEWDDRLGEWIVLPETTRS